MDVRKRVARESAANTPSRGGGGAKNSRRIASLEPGPEKVKEENTEKYQTQIVELAEGLERGIEDLLNGRVYDSVSIGRGNLEDAQLKAPSSIISRNTVGARPAPLRSEADSLANEEEWENDEEGARAHDLEMDQQEDDFLLFTSNELSQAMEEGLEEGASRVINEGRDRVNVLLDRLHTRERVKLMDEINFWMQKRWNFVIKDCQAMLDQENETQLRMKAADPDLESVRQHVRECDIGLVLKLSSFGTRLRSRRRFAAQKAVDRRRLLAKSPSNAEEIESEPEPNVDEPGMNRASVSVPLSDAASKGEANPLSPRPSHASIKLTRHQEGQGPAQADATGASTAKVAPAAAGPAGLAAKNKPNGESVNTLLEIISEIQEETTALTVDANFSESRLALLGLCREVSIKARDVRASQRKKDTTKKKMVYEIVESLTTNTQVRSIIKEICDKVLMEELNEQVLADHHLLVQLYSKVAPEHDSDLTDPLPSDAAAIDVEAMDEDTKQAYMELAKEVGAIQAAIDAMNMVDEVGSLGTVLASMVMKEESMQTNILTPSSVPLAALEGRRTSDSARRNEYGGEFGSVDDDLFANETDLFSPDDSRPGSTTERFGSKNDRLGSRSVVDRGSSKEWDHRDERLGSLRSQDHRSTSRAGSQASSSTEPDPQSLHTSPSLRPSPRKGRSSRIRPVAEDTEENFLAMEREQGDESDISELESVAGDNNDTDNRPPSSRAPSRLEKENILKETREKNAQLKLDIEEVQRTIDQMEDAIRVAMERTPSQVPLQEENAGGSRSTPSGSPEHEVGDSSPIWPVPSTRRRARLGAVGDRLDSETSSFDPLTAVTDNCELNAGLRTDNAPSGIDARRTSKEAIVSLGDPRPFQRSTSMPLTSRKSSFASESARRDSRATSSVIEAGEVDAVPHEADGQAVATPGRPNETRTQRRLTEPLPSTRKKSSLTSEGPGDSSATSFEAEAVPPEGDGLSDSEEGMGAEAVARDCPNKSVKSMYESLAERELILKELQDLDDKIRTLKESDDHEEALRSMLKGAAPKAKPVKSKELIDLEKDVKRKQGRVKELRRKWVEMRKAAGLSARLGQDRRASMQSMKGQPGIRSQSTVRRDHRSSFVSYVSAHSNQPSPAFQGQAQFSGFSVVQGGPLDVRSKDTNAARRRANSIGNVNEDTFAALPVEMQRKGGSWETLLRIMKRRKSAMELGADNWRRAASDGPEAPLAAVTRGLCATAGVAKWKRVIDRVAAERQRDEEVSAPSPPSEGSHKLDQNALFAPKTRAGVKQDTQSPGDEPASADQEPLPKARKRMTNPFLKTVIAAMERKRKLDEAGDESKQREPSDMWKALAAVEEKEDEPPSRAPAQLDASVVDDSPVFWDAPISVDPVDTPHADDASPGTSEPIRERYRTPFSRR